MILALGVTAAVLLVLTEVTTLIVIDVQGLGCEDAVANLEDAAECEKTGGEHHSFALLAVAVLVAVMAVGAGLGGSRPAGFALIAAGVVVLGIVLIGDLPDTSKTGQVGTRFDDADAGPGPAFWFELAGGLLALVAGGLRVADQRGAQATPAT